MIAFINVLLCVCTGRIDPIISPGAVSGHVHKLSGASRNPYARSYKSDELTWDGGRPISDRVSFVCVDYDVSYPETNNLTYLDCPAGMRAQIQFQSCWDGVNLYKNDQSHVAYMSQIDNGVCPDTHPVLLIHLFFEVYYGVNDIDQTDGGQFVFANGDPTGYGFHGDFLNGWDNATLVNGITDCVNNDTITNPSACPAFDVDENYSVNCPEEPAILNEKVHGWIGDTLPGCNPVTYGPEDATAVSDCNRTATSNNVTLDTASGMLDPEPGYRLGNWTYLGCATDSSSERALDGASYANSTSMTIELCMAYCAKKNLPLAGLEYADECYCGTTLGSTILSASVCDAKDYMLLWNNTAWVNPVPTVGVSTILSGKAVYAGCFSEATGIRALSKAATSGTNNTIMTNELCGTFCLGKGYSMFGTEYATVLLW
ncbi:putative wsc domain-containing protein [Phaeomoniella chlamydospora]|uniref:Putative wsc domain-containing protein n=1 Tax=Phaeomoniella chlamydospora TaxID=158046 RepID=A0A0G2ET01_PHACM|nr:putative wsc domain-containing protein [Phaeomoniella chlamydospora]